MSRPLVDHLIARGPVPRSGLFYDYVTAGDGVFVVAENDHLAVRVPVCEATIRGLPPLGSACVLKHGRVPLSVWLDAVRMARDWAAAGHETMVAVLWEPPHGYRTLRPPQVVSTTRVLYRPAPATVLEVHSHHRYAAFFSRTDDADEQGLRLYAVLGRLETERPEVAVRVGAFGYFLPLPWEAVFEGDRAPFRDAHFDIPDEERDDDLPG